MAAGLTVYNDNNKIQIDGAYKNLYLSRKLSLSQAGTTSGSFADGEVLACVGGTTSQTINAICINSPTGWTCVVKSFTSGMCVYVFGTKVTENAHGIGLQVFDENGNVVFDSNNKHPIVMAFGNKDATPAYSATKPAIAVCQNRRIDFNQNYVEIRHETFRESRLVYHQPVYDYVTEEYTEEVWVYDRYEMVAGHYENQWVAGHYENQYVPGTYQYNPLTGQYEWTSGGYQNVWVPGGYQSVWVPGGYQVVEPAHWERQTKTRRVYKMVQEGYYETVFEDVLYLCQYETIYYFYNETNFILQNGSVVSNTISEGTTGHGTRNLVSKQSFHGNGQDNVYWGSTYNFTSVVVDSRSWLLFDVKDL